MKHLILIILIFTIAIIDVHPQMMQLQTVLENIDKNNPELQMFDAQKEAFNAYAKGAKSWEPPQLGAGFFMSPYQTSLWKANNSANANGMSNTFNGMGSFMIQGQQMIPNSAKQMANQQYMQSMSEVEVANKNTAKNELFAKAKMGFYELVILKKKLLVLGEQEQLMDFVIETSKIRYPYQQEKLGSIFKAKADLVELQNMRIELESEMEQKRILINQMMNMDNNILFDIDTTIQLAKYNSFPSDTTYLLSRRSDVASIQKNIAVSMYKQKFEKTRLKPDFGIQYAHMFSFGNNPNLFTLMGMVTIPLAPWSSKMNRANVNGLNFQIEAYQKKKDAILIEASGMINSMASKIISKQKQISNYQKSILPALDKNYKSSLLAYEQNSEDLFVVLDALEGLQMARMELLNKTLELLTLQVDYEKVIEQR